MKIEYPYAENGLDNRGRRLPDIPMLWLELEADPHTRFQGPCIIDTGFDASLYANEDLVLLLENHTPTRKDTLYTVGREDITCDVFLVNAFITQPAASKRLRRLGPAEVFVPLLPDQLALEVILGRELLNRLTLVLSGKETTVL